MSRDLDSHFGEREQAAVEEWLRQSFAILSLLGIHSLVYRIEVHARLLILRKKSYLHWLILVCKFIDFEKKFPPAHLFGSH